MKLKMWKKRLPLCDCLQNSFMVLHTIMGIMKIKLKILALGAVMAVGGVNGVCSVNGVCGESGVCSVSGVWGESGVGSAETLRGEGEQSPQRASRKRPGAMRHTEAEVENARRVTAVKAKYIHDNAQFKGAAYMTGDAGGIKVGDVALSFAGGKYTIKFVSASFDMRKASTRRDRRREGITEYEYEHSWQKEKLGDDFDFGGRYEVVEQYGKVSLVLYNGNSDKVFAKIPLADANASSFEFAEDDVLFQFEKTD